MHILLTAATSWELRPALQALAQRAGLAEGPDGIKKIAFAMHRISAAVLGIGATRAAERLQELIALHKPEAVHLIGFSGGVQAGQKTGDITRPTLFSHRAGLPDICHGCAGSAAPLNRQVSVAALASPAMKLEIGRQWPDACGVDMESYAVAQVCKAQRLPLICRRVIFDPAVSSILSPANLLRLPVWYHRASQVLAESFKADLMKDGFLD